ncbi:hypothetical protein V9T40_005294 [Parthenolecanium corni]|uniref:Methenyltetrahydrofolate synthase domain-containing protein n=1 Tax=Parthenolecanium corni TaxID=536013 RepID=A0AAN9TUQ5_9HEMI
MQNVNGERGPFPLARALYSSTAPTKAVLSSTHNYTDKPKSVPLKSPVKVSPKAAVPLSKVTESSAAVKTNGLVKKMDSSPPKVVRSPSAKSITPPKTAAKTSPVKPALSRNNSQGDNIVLPVKSESSNELSGNSDAVNASDSKTDGTTGEAPLKLCCSSQNDKASSEDLIAATASLLKEKIILTTEQDHASGDKADNKEKSDVKDAGEGSSVFESKDVVEITKGDGSLVSVEIVEEKVILPAEVPSQEVTESTNDSSVKTVADNETEKPSEISANVPEEPSTGSPNASGVTDCSACSAETEKVAEITKQSLRLEMWDHLEKNDLVMFPRPCKSRIPNFKGAPVAADKLTSLDVFKNSKTIKINPDKPQEMARYHTLEYGKRLLVPVPRLREGLFQAVIPPSEASKWQLQQASQRYGMKRWSKPIGLDENVTIDLIILGSVLVDKKGHRIGKGEGFADLEFAMLVKMNAVNENTVIATTVHDDQVKDELPEHLFKEHDVPVDIIITPTQIIEVTEKLPRPERIIWEILSNRRILEIPILQKLREKEQSEGLECTLKEVDSDVEEKQYVQRFTRRRRFNNYSRSTGDPLRDSKLQPQGSQYYGGRRPFYRGPPPPPQSNRIQTPYPIRRNNMPPQKRVYYQEELEGQQPPMGRPLREPREPNMSQSNGPMRHRPQSMNRPRSMNRSQSMNRSRSMNRPQNGTRYMHRPQSGNRMPLNSNNGLTKSVEVQTVDKNTRSNRPFIKRKKPPIEFSLRVKNIGMGVRVRDLKIALNERGIKPRDITWRGYKGFACLHFVKPTSKENNKPLTVDDVIQTLQGLPLEPKEKKSLVIEPLKPKSPEESANEEKSEAVVVPTLVTTEL